MLFWDSIDYLINIKGTLPSRRARRRKRLLTVQLFPRKWMVITGCLIINGWYTNPTTVLIHNVFSEILRTENRAIRMSELIEMHPNALR